MRLPRLKEVRELHGWSQKKLAEESGVSRDSISNYETSQREAWPATARKLADALGVEIADLRESAREPAVPLAEASRGAGLDEWLERHGAQRILMLDEELIDNFDRMAAGSDRQAVPDRFQQEAHETFQEEAKVRDTLRKEWARGGDLLPKVGQARSRNAEYSRLKQEIGFRYRRYLNALDRYNMELYLAGKTDDFVMIVGRPQIAEARRAAIQALREEAFEDNRGA